VQLNTVKNQQERREISNISIFFHSKSMLLRTTMTKRFRIESTDSAVSSGGARILEQVGPAAGPKVE